MFEPCRYACSTRSLPRELADAASSGTRTHPDRAPVRADFACYACACRRKAARHAHTPAIAQNRSNVDTIIDARRYWHWQQNSQATKAFKAGNRPASFASARPAPAQNRSPGSPSRRCHGLPARRRSRPRTHPRGGRGAKGPGLRRRQRHAQAAPAHRGCADFAVVGRLPHRPRCRARGPPGDHLSRPGRRRALHRPRWRGPATHEGPASAKHPTPRHSSHRLRSPESLRSSDRWTDPPIRPGACGRREPGRLTRPPGIRGRGGTDRGSHLLSRLRIRNLGVAPTSARAIRAPDRPSRPP